MRTIYIALEDEGTDVWRPVEATELGDGVFEIPPDTQPPDDERWEFEPGARVRCELRVLSGGAALVAVEQVGRAG